MNVDLSNYFQDMSSLKGASSHSMAMQESAENGEIKSGIENMKPGDVFRGEIIDINNYDVTILLNGKDRLNATMAQALGFNIGDKVVFQVKDKNENQVVIRPLKDAGIPKELVNKSLSVAGLTATEKNIHIVKELINSGQPINRQSITNIIKLTGEFPSEPVGKLIDMTKNNIPVNEENLKMYDIYSESNHQIKNQIQEVIRGFSEYVEETFDKNAKVSQENSLDLFEKISAVFDEKPENNKAFAEKKANGELISDEKTSGEGVLEEKTNDEIITRVKEASEKIASEKIASEKNTSEKTASEKIAEEKTIDERTISEKLKTESEVSESGKSFSDKIVNAKSFDELVNVLKQSVNNADVENQGGQNPIKTAVKSGTLGKKVRELLNKEFYIDESKLENKAEIKNEVKKLYERLNKFLDIIKDYVPKEKDVNLNEGTTRLKSNIHFMNDLNNIEAYVQLPVKFQENEANGDLYVYGRKNNKYKPGDRLSAFLHLDMESLGATDVSIVLDNRHVTTKFTLDNDESYRIVMSHIDELAKKIEELGFTVNVTAEANKDNKNLPLAPITEKNENSVSIKRYTLDIRM